jgi:cohesin complex subunit SCC1
MREDYGNISLTVGEADYEMDDGFGGGGVALDFAEEPPEMLREAAAVTASTEVSLEPSLLREEEAGEASHISTSFAREKFRMEAPIRDDGFGGGVGGLEQEFMAGGLFEGGAALFEEPATPIAAPSPLPEEGEDFLPPASPMLSEGESRPGTPASVASAGLERVAPPTLDQTPVISPPPPPVEEAAAAAAHEQTTLLHNEVESFALAPVEASALGRAAGGERRKRKRKLIVDEIKAISGEGMKAQLSDSADIVTTLDIAPPTKRLMHWKETGGVEELFSLPGRTLGARNIFKTYQKCLKQIPAGAAADERFETLHGDTDREELHLVHIGGAAAERPPAVPPPPKEKPTAPGKRKRAAEAAESAYAKRQQELVRLQEEFAREEAVRRQKPAEISLPRVTAEEEEEEQRQMMASPLPPPAALEETGGLDLDHLPPGTPGSPIRQPDLFGTLIASPRAAAVGPPAAELTFAQQATLTEQWVSQVEPAALPEEEEEDLGGYEPPPEYPEEEEEEPCAGEEEEEEFPADIAAGGPADESAMQEDETIEQYEDRVLNKRAAQMHRHLAKRFEAEKELELDSLLRNNHRKQVAQKFYSILVLQKVMAVEASQSSEAPFGSIRIARGPKFESALQSL